MFKFLYSEFQAAEYYHNIPQQCEYILMLCRKSFRKISYPFIAENGSFKDV